MSETIKQDVSCDVIVVAMRMSPLVAFLLDLHSIENMEYILSNSAFSFNVVLRFTLWFALK